MGKKHIADLSAASSPVIADTDLSLLQRTSLSVGDQERKVTRLDYLTGAAIGGKVSFSGTSHVGLRLNNLTTTQRDAIASPTEGDLIWNSTTHAANAYDGSAWGALGGGGSTADPLLLSAGSAGAPTFSFTGDPDTGIYNSAANVLAISAGGTLRASVSSTAVTLAADLLFTDATYDIGKSGATRPRDIFLSRNLTVGGTTSFAGNIVSDLLFTDATYDIGKSGATRPRDVFLSRNLTVGGTASFGGNVVSDLLFTDATFDIGKSGATRPRDIFLSRNLTVGGATSLGGNVVSNVLFTDNSFDIGATGATRPRTGYFGTQLCVEKSAIGSTATDGLRLVNSSAATSGAREQYSTALRFTGATWKTAGSTSQVIDGRVYLVGQNGASPTYLLNFDFQIGGAGYATQMTLRNDGQLVINGDLSAGGSLVCTGNASQFGQTTMLGDLLFTDASFDIGKSGATRPRDGFFSRNFVAGGTGSFGGAVNMNSHLINNVTDPSSAQDAATKNYADTTFLKLAGGTLTAKVSFSGTGHVGLRLNNLTTTQRDAIGSPTAGDLIWNTTTESVQRYSGSAWADVGGGGSTPDPLLLGNGSAGAPTFSFSGDTDTGLYRSAANVLSFATGGTKWWSVDSSGNLVQESTGVLSAPDDGHSFGGYNPVWSIKVNIAGVGFGWIPVMT